MNMEDRKKQTRERANAELAQRRKISQAVRRVEYDEYLSDMDLIVENITKRELGEFGQWDGETYKLTREEMTLLLVNARKDALAAHVITKDAYKNIWFIFVFTQRTRALVFIVLLLQIATLLWQFFG